MNIQHNLTDLLSNLPPAVKLVAVSKNQSESAILEAYQLGQFRFGENKVQEIVRKQAVLPGNIEWHFIGHLQTNKVRYIVPFVRLIHSIDSLKLLAEVNREATKINRVVDCLLEIHIAMEDSKFGLKIPDVYTLLESKDYRSMQNVRISGLMGMATFTDDLVQVRKEFRLLHEYFQQIKRDYFPDDPDFKEISMGMSDDYPIAVEEGSTIVRIGTAIFGERRVDQG
jgi:PLP dependent protein